jgi:hypothetical protein
MLGLLCSRQMSWALVNLIAFVGAPVGFLYGCWLYWTESQQSRSLRLRFSLVGLSAVAVSFAGWLVLVIVANVLGLHSSDGPIRRAIGLGALLPLLGMVVSFFGRPRFILPIALASVGTVLFWIGTTAA